MADTFSLAGLKPADVYSKLTEKGVSEGNAAILVGEWILENAGRRRRVFTFSQAFAPRDADCTAQFVRSFAHDDWVDGVSVVQAGETPSEEGFNRRFHAIEDDLDELSRDVVRAFECLGEMRAQIAQLLSEIQTALNLTNSDVFDCCRGEDGRIFEGPVKIATAPQFKGVTKFLNQNVSVWETPEGVTMLPMAMTINATAPGGDVLGGAADFSRFLAEEAEVAAAFPDRVTRAQMLERFGDREVGESRTVADVLSVLPDDARFNSLDAMTTAVVERSATALRATGASGAVVATSFSDFGVGVEDTRTAPVERLEAVPAEAREALASAGIATVADLAALKPAEVTAHA